MESVLLYRLYSRDETLLYIGITKRLKFRIADHKRDQYWGNRIEHVETIEFPNRESAHIAEIEAIQTESPKYNIHKYWPSGY
jgi:excinuclease UvrABC nuclease subunit